MRFLPRQITDKAFTVLTGASIVLLTLVLVVVLGPMLWRGGKAVFFTDTIEFRKMQRDRYSRGDLETLQQQAAQAQTFRSQAYAIIDEFRNGIDTEGLVARSKQVYRQFGKELRYRDLPREDYREIRSQGCSGLPHGRAFCGHRRCGVFCAGRRVSGVCRDC